MVDQLTLLLIFLKSSALAIGGLASLPLLREGLVPQYASEAQIVQALAISRLSPGPNGLYLVSIGYILGGLVGAVSAFFAASLVPLVILPATTLARRWLMSPWFGGVIRGVSLASAGLLAATAIDIGAAAGTAPWQLMLASVAAIVTVQGKLHPAILMALGVTTGIGAAWFLGPMP